MSSPTVLTNRTRTLVTELAQEKFDVWSGQSVHGRET